MPVAWDNVQLKLNPGMERVRSDDRRSELFGPPLTDLEFWLVWSGKGQISVDGQSLTLRPGVLLVRRPGHEYSAASSTEQRLAFTAIPFGLLDRRGHHVLRDEQLPMHVSEVADVGYVDSVSRRVVELATSATSDVFDREHRDISVATQLFGALLRDLDEERLPPSSPIPIGTDRRHIELISEAATRINESPQDAPSLEELSSRAGYTKDHFARVFKKVLGQTPQDYLIHARVRRARQLLVESSLSIKEIACALGYRDVYFFSRQFKLKMGMTPSEARRRGLLVDRV